MEEQPKKKGIGPVWGCLFGVFMLVMVAVIITMLLPDASSDDSPATAPASAPAPTPNAAAAVADCPNTTQAVYFLEATEATGPISASFGEVSRLFLEAAEDPTLLLSERWTVEVAAELVTLQLAADVIRAINPAPGTNAIHTELLRMADKLDDLIQSLISGIDDLDISAFERAATLMTGITTDFQTATELTVSFCD